MKRVSPGQPWKPRSADDENAIAEAAEFYQQQVKLGRGIQGGGSHALDRLFLKNTSGGALGRGKVLEVGTNLLSSWTDHDHLWFTGSTPSPNGTKGIAVLLFPAGSNDIVECKSVGLCKAKVNINHAQHIYADVDSGSTLLQSKWHGRALILDRESGTGEKWALVHLGEMFRGPIWGAAPSGIARGSFGTVNVYWGESAGALIAASPSSSVTVYFDFMNGGPTDVPTNGELWFTWEPSRQKYMIGNGECAH